MSDPSTTIEQSRPNTMPADPRKKQQHAPSRDHLAPPEDFGITLSPEAIVLASDPAALAKAYGGSGLTDLAKNRVALLCSLCATTGGLLFGFDQGLVSVTLVMPGFLSQFPDVDPNVTSAASLNKGVMTALLELGAFLGALMAGFVADRWSRKVAIQMGVVWFVIGSTLQTASFGLAQLIVGRFIGGIGVGVLSTMAPTYISEIAPPNVRGAMLVLQEFAIVLGIVVMFYITYGTRHIVGEWCFRLPFLIQMVPAFPLAVALLFFPYSPRWLASKGRDGDCLASLSRLRRLPTSDPRLQAEWLQIRAEACRNREALVARHPKLAGDDLRSELKLEAASWIDMFKPGVIRRTLIGMAIMFFQQFSGVNALIYYSPTLFEQLGLDYELQLTLSGALNLSQLVAVIPAIFFLDKVGRRKPLIAGAIGMTVSHLVVAGMISRGQGDWGNHGVEAWVGVGFIIFWMIPFGMCWGTVPWALPSEVFPSSRRAKGVALTTCSHWFSNFIVGLITPPLVSGTGYGVFVFFGVFCFLAGVWAWFCVPETKGITLEQMDRVFGGHTARDDLIAKAEITRTLAGGRAPSFSGSEKGPDDKNVDTVWVEQV